MVALNLMKFLLSVTVISIFVFVSGVDSVLNSKNIEMEVIPKTNLLSGVYYQISVPNFTFALFTWTDLNSVKDFGNFAQIDDHTDRIERYLKPSGDWYKDSLWTFQPAKDSPGFYLMKNAGVANGILVAPKESEVPEKMTPEDRYALLLKYQSINYNIGSSKRDYALWQIYPTGKRDQYRIRNKATRSFLVPARRYGEFYKFVTFKSSNDLINANIRDSYFRFKAISV